MSTRPVAVTHHLVGELVHEVVEALLDVHTAIGGPESQLRVGRSDHVIHDLRHTTTWSEW